jgi:tetratricopeptide (TPR) repeat protein
VSRLPGGLSRDTFGVVNVPAVHSRTWLAFCLAELGGFRDGIVYGEEAVRIAESLQRPPARALAWAGLGVLYVRQGKLEQALPILEQCLAFIRAHDLRLWMPIIASTLGLGYALSGRVVEALPLVDGAVARASDLGLGVVRVPCLASSARAHLIAGDVDQARVLATEALECARQRGEKGHEAIALRLCGDVAVHSQPPDRDRGEAYCREALVRGEELRMRPLVAHCHASLASLYYRTDRREQAREHLTTATTMYREMGMTYWLEKAEALGN